ncbi:MAG: oxidoreductase [Magnetococcales bacterium]|nr:oxidoreductase [Magnetococcales bacterium]
MPDTPSNLVLLVHRDADGAHRSEITPFPSESLPEGDVLVRVIRSGINYKDALAVTGRGPILRRFPMIPGIDLTGEVVASENPDWSPGDAVILTGHGVGETRHGAFTQYTRLPGAWLIPRPAGLTSDGAMLLGTAGLTAMLCVMALEDGGIRPDGNAEILVTGPTGGVGGWAVVLLKQLGYRVCAATGRLAHESYLRQLGAETVIDRQELTASNKPLDTQRWSGAIDVAGGKTLAGLLKFIHYGGTVAACGLADEPGLPATVFPFILRNIRLQGIDSVHIDRETRATAWKRMAEAIPSELFATFLERTVGLNGIPQACQELLDGQVRGRVLVDPFLGP